MRGMSTILIAGDEALFLDLAERLVGSEARALYCEAVGETLDRAADAAAVVVDSGISGGGEALCRRLRADPTTATVPLLLRSRSPVESHFADEVVAGGVEVVLAALLRRVPALAQSGIAGRQPIAPPTPPLTARTTQPAEGANDPWQADPPEALPGEDLLAYHGRCEQFLDRLVEAHEGATELAMPRRVQLMEQSHRVVVMMDGVLDGAQKAVNEALRAKDLARMRALSDGKTALFEKLQRLRSAVRTADSVPRVALGKGLAPSPAVAAGAPGAAPPPRVEATRSESDPGVPTVVQGLRPQKSQLTLAAERRAQQQREPKREATGTRAGAVRGAPDTGSTPSPRRRREATAARHAAARAPRARPLWLAIPVLVALVLVALLFGRSPTPPAAAPTANQPPQMVHVTVQETPAGVLARPEARDPEEDRVTFSIRWFVDGVLVPGAATVRLASDRVQVGQSIYVEVTPSDSYGSGSAMRSQGLTIQGVKRRGGANAPSGAGEE